MNQRRKSFVVPANCLTILYYIWIRKYLFIITTMIINNNIFLKTSLHKSRFPFVILYLMVLTPEWRTVSVLHICTQYNYHRHRMMYRALLYREPDKLTPMTNLRDNCCGTAPTEKSSSSELLSQQNRSKKYKIIHFVRKRPQIARLAWDLHVNAPRNDLLKFHRLGEGRTSKTPRQLPGNNGNAH